MLIIADAAHHQLLWIILNITFLVGLDIPKSVFLTLSVASILVVICVDITYDFLDGAFRSQGVPT